MLIIPQDGSLFIQEAFRRGVALAPSACLFVNDYLPTQTTTLADLLEATFPGYARILLNAWNPATPDGNNGALLVHPAVQWFNTGLLPANVAYGWFAVQLDWTATLRLLWAERGPFPIDFGVPSATLILQAGYDFRSLFG